MKRPEVCPFVVVLSLFIGACAGPPAPPPDWAPGEQDSASPDAGASVVRAADLLPEMFGGEAPEPSEFAGTADGEPTQVRYKTECADGRCTVSEFVGDNDSPREVSEFVKTNSGGVALARVTSHDRGTITEFVPPMLVLPATAERAGQEWAQRLELIVHPIDDPTKTQNRGDARSTLTYRGMQRIETGAGTIEAAAFTEKMEASLGAASVLVITRHWYAPGDGQRPAGMAAEQHQEMISVLGLPGERVVRELRRR